MEQKAVGLEMYSAVVRLTEYEEKYLAKLCPTPEKVTRYIESTAEYFDSYTERNYFNEDKAYVAEWTASARRGNHSAARYKYAPVMADATFNLSEGGAAIGSVITTNNHKHGAISYKFSEALQRPDKPAPERVVKSRSDNP